MKYSIILPSHDPELKNHEMFMNLVDSIQKNSKGRDYEMIIRKNGPSYTESTNDAFKSSRGDYLILLQDDMLIEDSEWLEKLTDEECFVTTEINKFHLDNSDCPLWTLFGMPRKVFEKVGLLDEAFKNGTCYEDNDYIFRMKELEIPIKVVPVKFKHFGSVATNVYFNEKKNDMMYRNHKIFCEKWKHKLNI